MNQILQTYLNNKSYKSKIKNNLKIQLYFSVLLIAFIIGTFIYKSIKIYKQEKYSKQILENYNIIRIYSNLSSINTEPDSSITKNNITSDIRFRKGLFDGIFLEILDSYMIKYNLGMWAVNDIAYNDLLNKSLYLTKEYEVNEKPKLKENAKQLLNQLDTRKKVVSLVGKNISENKIISEFIKNIFQDEYDISVEITLLDDNELENYLKEKKFDIYIDDFDLDTYKLSNDYILEELNESLRDDYSIISLYYKNFLWCKSSKIDNLYIDANGNLILKYTKI